jgi:hypothetical protein
MQTSSKLEPLAIAPKTTKPYQRCLVMAGGGFRFGYYLGIHAALEQQGRTPDLLLASCGGALAAAIIQALPDAQSRFEYLASETMYQHWQQIAPGPGARLSSVLRQACQRRFSRQQCTRIPDLFSDYLFELPEALPHPKVGISSTTGSSPSVAIIGAELLFSPQQAGQLRNQQALFQQVLFAANTAVVAGAIAHLQAPLSSNNTVILPTIAVQAEVPLGVMLRIAVSDMFYFRPACYQDRYFLGGAIDLMPLEIAKALAFEVIAERKAAYDFSLASPAIAKVFGVDPNQRLAQAMAYTDVSWLDTRDMRQQLPQGIVQKSLDWRKNLLKLSAAPSYAAYRDVVLKQWQYGFACASK